MNISYSEEALSVTSSGILWAVYSGILVASLAGNILVIGTLFRSQRQERHRPSIIMVIFLAIVDLTNATTSIPTVMMTLANRTWVLGEVMCTVQGLVYITLTTTANSTLCMISINRFHMIDSPNTHRSVIRRRVARMLYTSTAHGLLTAALTLLPWGEMRYKPTHLMCQMSWRSTPASTLHMVLIWTLSYLTPLLCMAISYMKILRIVKFRRTKVHNLLSSQVITTGSIGDRVSGSMLHKHTSFQTTSLDTFNKTSTQTTLLPDTLNKTSRQMSLVPSLYNVQTPAGTPANKWCCKPRQE